MIVLTNAQYAKLVADAAVATHQQQRAEDAEARYAALVERSLATPKTADATPFTPLVSLPASVLDALEDFRSDPELYAYNSRWASQNLAAGQAPESVAKMIRYGQSADDYAAILS